MCIANFSKLYNYLSEKLVAYAKLARLEKPIGWQLLSWPCLISLLMALTSPLQSSVSFPRALYYAGLFVLGSIFMRGAGCTINDLADIEIDKKVSRTKTRPLANGMVSKTEAWLFVALQALCGLVILLQFNRLTIYIAFGSLFFVVIYPYMKRITYVPQLFLGIAFNWGCFLGWTSVKNSFAWCLIPLYIACIWWTVSFDTIYAYQDIEDDMKIDIGSTAQLFQERIYLPLFSLYSLFLSFMALSFYAAQLPYLAYFGLGGAALHFAWQLKTLNIKCPATCLRLFKSNNYVGLFICAGLALAYGYSFL